MDEARSAVPLCGVVAKSSSACRRAILLQKDAANQLTPRNKLREIDEKLIGYNVLCTSESSRSVLHMLLIDLGTSRSKCDNARFLCTSRCRDASRDIHSYLDYDQDDEKELIPDGIKRILLLMLEEAVGRLSQAAEMYESSSSLMGVVAERIASLAAEVDSEYRSGRWYYNEQRKRIQTGLSSMMRFAVFVAGAFLAAIGGAWNGLKGSVAGGCCGVVISGISSMIVVRGRVRTGMETERRDIQEEYAGMRRSVEAVQVSTDAIRSGMMKEVAAIVSKLKRVEGVPVDVSCDNDTAKALRSLLSALMQACNSRIKQDELLGTAR